MVKTFIHDFKDRKWLHHVEKERNGEMMMILINIETHQQNELIESKKILQISKEKCQSPCKSVKWPLFRRLKLLLFIALSFYFANLLT